MNAVEEKERERQEEKEKEWATNGPGKEISPWKHIPKRKELGVEANRRPALPGTEVF